MEETVTATIDDLTKNKKALKIMRDSWKKLPGKQKKKYQMASLTGTFVEPVKTITNLIPKIGRNEKCPCGSGKKFKFCCGK